MLNDMCRFHVGKLQRCAAMQHAALHNSRNRWQKKKQSLAHFNIYWLIRIRGIVVFSISVSSKLFPVWVIMPVTLCYLAGNSIIALVDSKWSHCTQSLSVIWLWPDHPHDAPVATNQFPTLSNELCFCISSLDLNFVPWSPSKQESRIIANFTL